jgi:hypothetical protein
VPNQPTNAAWVAAVQALTVTGVTRHYDEPPGSLDTADLPAAFPTLMTAGLPGFEVSCRLQNKSRTIGFIVCLEPFAQGTNAQNYALLATMLDNLETAFDGLSDAHTDISNFVDYTMNAGVYTVAGTDYWSIVCELESRGT